MASSKERARWERWYDAVKARMDRQKVALDRLILIDMEFSAALMQIADDPEIRTIKQARARAKEAIERMREAAAATQQEVEAIADAEALPDPRSNR